MCENRMCTCMCNWVTMLYSRKLTEHCKSGIMGKNKNHYIYIYIYIYIRNLHLQTLKKILLFFFLAMPMACESSQARHQIHATVATKPQP